MSRKYFKTEEAYEENKIKEYRRYYVSTQLYEPRTWTDDEVKLLINNYSLTARELSNILHRSIKSIEHKKGYLRKHGLVQE